MRPSTFDAVLNTLIPPSPSRGIPGAGEAGTRTFIEEKKESAGLIESALAIVPDGFEDFAKPERTAALKTVEQFEPDGFAELIRLTYMGFYSQPHIRGLHGLSSDAVHPNGYSVEFESSNLMSELTAPVVARGKVYRDVQ